MSFPIKGVTPPFGRVALFLICFMVAASLLGARIIGGGILYRDGFALYAEGGKAAVFGLIAFWLLARRTPQHMKLKPWRPVLLAWAAFALLCFVAAWVAVHELLAGSRTVGWLLLAHAGILASVVAGALAALGSNGMSALWRWYRGQLVLSAGIAGVFYFFLLGVYALWRPLAATVLYAVHHLLALTGIATEVVHPNILITDKFSITVAQYCSGIESIALFCGLYIVVGLLERHRLHVVRYALLWPLALVVLFGLNILRIFVLIVAGYYINPGIAFSLFHTYAGLVFFILYSAAFWAVAYRYILIHKEGSV